MPPQQRRLDELVQAAADTDGDPVARLADLVAAIRPSNRKDTESSCRVLQALCHILDNQPALRVGFRDALIRFLNSYKGVSFYADAGMFPNRGFFAETARRISRCLLPDDTNGDHLKEVVSRIFDRASDAAWISAVPDQLWCDLLLALRLEEMDVRAAAAPLVEGICDGLRVVSYRIAAIGLEPELVRLAPALEHSDSPFLAQNPQMLRYLAAYRTAWYGSGNMTEPAELQALLDQGRALMDRVRSQASRDGTSLSLTLLLQRMNQHLARCRLLLGVLTAFARRRSVSDASPSLVALIKRLIADECRRNDVREFWRANVDILARRVTDNASRRGEHYITSQRAEFFAMFRSAALGGFIIAFMALFKLFILEAHLPPLTEALAVCLNYGLGFVLIHMLHGTVATKQPAMTAATIAASIDHAHNDQGNLTPLAVLIARTTRSQLVAIVGNVSVALPTAMLLGFALNRLSGVPYPLPEKAQHLIADIHPWLSGSLVFAAIAGGCLFLAGLISGYFDNLAAYNRIPQRLMALSWPRRLFGEARWAHAARYIKQHLGALAGNFFLGFLLGGATAFGTLFGLPVDIRHVTFASANLGYSLNALGYAVPWSEIVIASAGVVLIGFINLIVSFSLSLRIACRARQVTISGRALLRNVFALALRRPREFLLPPSREATKAAKTSSTTHGFAKPAADVNGSRQDRAMTMDYANATRAHETNRAAAVTYADSENE
jgi:site-specific recombinase